MTLWASSQDQCLAVPRVSGIKRLFLTMGDQECPAIAYSQQVFVCQVSYVVWKIREETFRTRVPAGERGAASGGATGWFTAITQHISSEEIHAVFRSDTLTSCTNVLWVITEHFTDGSFFHFALNVSGGRRVLEEL